MLNVRLDLHFFLQGSPPFWKKIQVELKSFWVPADANIDVYIVFICINGCKKGSNNYRYDLYIHLYPAQISVLFSVTFYAFLHYFMQLRTVCAKK